MAPLPLPANIRLSRVGSLSALDPVEATKRYGPLGSQFLAKPFDPSELITMLRTFLLQKE